MGGCWPPQADQWPARSPHRNQGRLQATHHNASQQGDISRQQRDLHDPHPHPGGGFNPSPPGPLAFPGRRFLGHFPSAPSVTKEYSLRGCCGGWDRPPSPPGLLVQPCWGQLRPAGLGWAGLKIIDGHLGILAKKWCI